MIIFLCKFPFCKPTKIFVRNKLIRIFLLIAIYINIKLRNNGNLFILPTNIFIEFRNSFFIK